MCLVWQGKKPAKSAAVTMEEDSDGSDYNPDSASESDADSQVAAFYRFLLSCDCLDDLQCMKWQLMRAACMSSESEARSTYAKVSIQ